MEECSITWGETNAWLVAISNMGTFFYRLLAVSREMIMQEVEVELGSEGQVGVL